jgi:hypothetical protein
MAETTADQVFPRRARVDKWVPAELAIAAAVEAVEATGADVRLTDAVVLLQAARASVADFVDGDHVRRGYFTDLRTASYQPTNPLLEVKRALRGLDVMDGVQLPDEDVARTVEMVVKGYREFKQELNDMNRANAMVLKAALDRAELAEATCQAAQATASANHLKAGDRTVQLDRVVAITTNCGQVEHRPDGAVITHAGYMPNCPLCQADVKKAAQVG